MKFKLILAATLFAQSTLAADSLSTKIHNQYISLRALGMGNAFTAVADDYSLIYYNPAGFARKKTNEVQFSVVGAGAATDTMKLAKDVSDASKTSGTDQQKAEAIGNALQPYYGKALGGRVQLAEMFWIRKNWGISLIPMDLSLDLTVNKQLGPAVDLNVKGDTTLAFGLGRNYSKEIAWGVTVKGVHRVAVAETVPAIELATNSSFLSNERFSEGLAIDADLGLIYTPAWFAKNKARMPQAEKAKSKKNAEQENVVKSEEENADKVDLSLEGIPATSGTEKTAEKKDDKIKSKKEESIASTEEDEVYPLTFSLVARNVIGGKFTKMKLVNKNATMAPQEMYRVIDVGSQYEIARFGSFVVRSMLDIKNILHPEISEVKALHAGLEFDYSPSGWFKAQFRGGFNQGYYTAGTTLLLGVFNIEAVTYGEEVGTKANKLENRVYAAKLGMNF